MNSANRAFPPKPQTRQLELDFGASSGDAGVSVPLGSCEEGWGGVIKMSVFSEQSLLGKTVV